MKKILIFFIIISLTSCSKNILPKSPNELLLEIKDYSCKMQISFYSNKNTNEYIATQSYLSTGTYSMEFLSGENLKIDYKNSILNISSELAKTPLTFTEYEELNKNPLFLSYFINTYFNSESTDDIKISNDCVELVLPKNSQYLHSAKLYFKNNIPYELSYFDEHGNIKVNIIYNEFTLNA